MDQEHKLQIKKLSIQEIIFIYQNHLIYDFPKSEVKPLTMIEQGCEKGVYEAYGAFHQDQLYGYAFFIRHSQQDIVLLDYFAVVRQFRSLGTGSQFLMELNKVYSNQQKRIFLEIENPYFASNSKEKELREKRQSFYEKNQVHVSGIKCCFITDEYCILYTGSLLNDKQVSENILSLYEDYFGKEFVQEKVRFHD